MHNMTMLKIYEYLDSIFFARAIKKNESITVLLNLKEINDNIEEFCVKTTKGECTTCIISFKDTVLKLRMNAQEIL